MAKIDPYGHKQKYEKWKSEGKPMGNLIESLAQPLRDHILDMELGVNIHPGSKKGPRSHIRLNNLRGRLVSWGFYLHNEMGITDWLQLVDRQRDLMIAIKKARDGFMPSRRLNESYITSVGTYVKALKAFWHWLQRVERQKGNNIPDVTQDMDARDKKPKFNYFTLDQLSKLCTNTKQYYRIQMMFMFDSGIRSPTELMNVRVSDLEWNEKSSIYTLNIREETSKTFGRRIKLMLCSTILQQYIEHEQLKPQDYIFTKTPSRVNQHLKYLGHKVLGIGKKNGKKRYHIKDGLTMYDFRHSSACYWTPRYKSESALKYRFGWKKSDMIHYYTELLGMRDTIQEEDLYVDVTKTQIEQKMIEQSREIELLNEQLKVQEDKFERFNKILDALEVEMTIPK